MTDDEKKLAELEAGEMTRQANARVAAAQTDAGDRYRIKNEERIAEIERADAALPTDSVRVCQLERMGGTACEPETRKGCVMCVEYKLDASPECDELTHQENAAIRSNAVRQSRAEQIAALLAAATIEIVLSESAATEHQVTVDGVVIGRWAGPDSYSAAGACVDCLEGIKAEVRCGYGIWKSRTDRGDLTMASDNFDREQSRRPDLAAVIDSPRAPSRVDQLVAILQDADIDVCEGEVAGCPLYAVTIDGLPTGQEFNNYDGAMCVTGWLDAIREEAI